MQQQHTDIPAAAAPTYISNVLESLVAKQLSSPISNSNLSESSLSAFKSCHSIETSLIKVVDYLLLNIHSSSTSVLLLVDLRAAFDTTDHCILLGRLENKFGVSRMVLAWPKEHS